MLEVGLAQHERRVDEQRGERERQVVGVGHSRCARDSVRRVGLAGGAWWNGIGGRGGRGNQQPGGAGGRGGPIHAIAAAIRNRIRTILCRRVTRAIAASWAGVGVHS
jgi:hypothetical protein